MSRKLMAEKSSETIKRQADGIVVTIGDGQLRIQVWAEDVVRISYTKSSIFPNQQTLAAIASEPSDSVHWELSSNSGQATITTAKLSVRLDLNSGAISFFDSAGNPILTEKPGARTMTPAQVQGEKTFHIQQQWEAGEGESLYGLGQHQLGLMDIKGYDLDLWQHNGTVFIPFLVSSRGYGIFWDNTSLTRFGDLRKFEAIPAKSLYDAEGKPGGLTGSYFDGANFNQLVGKRVDEKILIDPPHNPNPTTQPVPTTEAAPRESWRSNKRIHPDLVDHGDISIRWEGLVDPPVTGDYQFQTYSNAGIKVWINDKLVIDHWRQGWLPWYDVAKVHLEAHRRAKLKVEWSKDQGDDQVQLCWKTPSSSDATSLWSEVGEGIDYYFMYGPQLDRVVAGYRKITGQAPMLPQWALGLWQSRQRYETQQQIVDVLQGFRSRKIPIDNIVQDWFYWKADAWGSHQFDPVRFPDPAGLLKTVHEKFHAHFMISVWPKFYPGTKNFDEMQSRGFLYQRDLQEKIHDWVGFIYTFYDAFNPEAGKLFWDQMRRNLLPLGIDSWWLDATEPDLTRNPTL
ncbi:MAG TPA: TIM-barrel domain-containing protein, partial [Tepidisphaeraceae bacterium]|nr:TIM-barrel domain-containing protein [Tepidisphaeraceae bacterium]